MNKKEVEQMLQKAVETQHTEKEVEKDVQNMYAGAVRRTPEGILQGAGAKECDHVWSVYNRS